MTKFIGSNRDDFAFAGGGQLEGFKGGSAHQLKDTIGDKIFGLGGNDLIAAGEGDDQINGGRGNDIILGNGGNDVLNAGASSPDVNGIGFELLAGGAGNDIFNVSARNSRNVLVDYHAEDELNGVTVNLAAGTATDTFGDTDTLHGVTSVIGTILDDHFTGAATDDFFDPSDGVDTIDGGDGTDTLFYGEIAQFALNPGSNNSGITVNMGEADNSGTVIDANGDTDTFTNIEHIVGTGDDDTFNAGLSDAWFSGGAGHDTFNGSQVAQDTVDYSLDVIGGGLKGVTVDLFAGTATDGFGNSDTLSFIDNVVGTRFADTLKGSNDANRLEGGGGNDTIDGRDGADTIIGGLGKDLMEAGEGDGRGDGAQDTFIFKSIAEIGKGAKADHITHFEGGFGGDIVDLTAIDANTHRHGNQDFNYIGDAKFHHKAGELHLVESVKGFTHLEGDVNGDGKADFRLDFSGFGFSGFGTDNIHGIIPEN